MLKGFRDFVLRGNVVDLAVAVILGAAFNAIVTSLVGDVLNPLIAATIGKPDFSVSFCTSETATSRSATSSMPSFVSHCCVGGLLRYRSAGQRAPGASEEARSASTSPRNQNCPECLTAIPKAAKRCASCTQPVA